MKIFVNVLKALCRLIFLPISAGLYTRRNIVKDLSKPAANDIRYRREVYKHNLSHYAFFTAIWCVIAYFGWPYIETGLWWILYFVIEGVWSIHFSDTTWAALYGALAACVIIAVLRTYDRMQEHKREMEELWRKLRNTNDSASHWEGMYCELLAGLMVVKKQALDNKESARSKYAAMIREDLEKVLNEHPAYVNLLIRINPATERWEGKLKKTEVKAS